MIPKCTHVTQTANSAAVTSGRLLRRYRCCQLATREAEEADSDSSEHEIEEE